ncbi:unnamed protein product, partial [Pylaiella littoralis]
MTIGDPGGRTKLANMLATQPSRSSLSARVAAQQGLNRVWHGPEYSARCGLRIEGGVRTIAS